MAKFRCIKGVEDFPVGTIIEAERVGGDCIRILEDTNIKLSENEPFFGKGEIIPITGYVYQWKSCEGEPDKEELLARFEDAIRQNSSDYESAREELLKRSS